MDKSTNELIAMLRETVKEYQETVASFVKMVSPQPFDQFTGKIITTK